MSRIVSLIQNLDGELMRESGHGIRRIVLPRAAWRALGAQIATRWKPEFRDESLDPTTIIVPGPSDWIDIVQEDTDGVS